MNYIFVSYKSDPAGIPYGSVDLCEVLAARVYTKSNEIFIEIIFKSGHMTSVSIETPQQIHDFFLALSRT